MNKKYISILSLLFITASLIPATIRVYNKLEEKIAVTVITRQQKVTEPIEATGSHLFNTWCNAIIGFEWEIKGSVWTAPLEVRALQTEGRLHIEGDGKYSFKPCLPCRESNGQATLATSKPIAIPAAEPVAIKGNQLLQQQIQEGTQLKSAAARKLPPRPASKENNSGRQNVLQDIPQGAQLKSVAQRQLAPKPVSTSVSPEDALKARVGQFIQKRRGQSTDTDAAPSSDKSDEEWSESIESAASTTSKENKSGGTNLQHNKGVSLKNAAASESPPKPAAKLSADETQAMKQAIQKRRQGLVGSDEEWSD